MAMKFTARRSLSTFSMRSSHSEFPDLNFLRNSKG